MYRRLSSLRRVANSVVNTVVRRLEVDGTFRAVLFEVIDRSIQRSLLTVRMTISVPGSRIKSLSPST
jgi:hypothetical protein